MLNNNMRPLSQILPTLSGQNEPGEAQAPSDREAWRAILDQAARENQARQIEESRAHRRALEVKAANIPQRFIDADLYATPKAGQEAAYEAARAFFDRWHGGRGKGAGLLFFGPVGAGKSHLLCSLANEVRKEPGLRAMYSTALGICSRIKATFAKDAQETTEQAYQAISGVDLLCIDELGRQYCTDTERLILWNIADARNLACLPTVMATNFAQNNENESDIIQSLLELLGESCLDRLLGYGSAIVYVPRVGLSLRQKVEL